LRQIDFDLTAGAITTASHPSAVSTSMGSLIAINQAHCLGGKMLSGDAELASHAFATTSGHSLSNNSMFGIDQYGNRYADTTLDTLAGGIGAFSHRDGIDFGGPHHRRRWQVLRRRAVRASHPVLVRLPARVALLRRPRSLARRRHVGDAWVGTTPTSRSSVRAAAQERDHRPRSVRRLSRDLGASLARDGQRYPTMVQRRRVPGDPVELRKMAPHGDLAPPKKYDNRLGSTTCSSSWPTRRGLG
jgi:hypothetical protein